MADYSDLDPTALRRSVSDGTRLKKSITTDLYTGGTPTAANQVKRSIMYADGTLKESIANASGLKPSWLVAGGGGGGAWSPSDLGADLLAWYDASDAGTVTESAGSVSQWDDKSGNNRHVSQGTGANQPTYNGTNEVDFDSASSQYLFNSSPFMYNNGSADMYIVGSAIVTTFGSIVAEGSSSSGNPIYVPMETGSSTAMSTYARNDGGTTMLSHPAIFTASGIWDDAQKLYAVTDDGSNIKGWIDSEEGTNQAYTRSGTMTVDRFAVGALLRSSAIYPINGALNEVVITAVLSQEDRERVEGYLAHKHNITDRLPVDHPYKSEAP